MKRTGMIAMLAIFALMITGAGLVMAEVGVTDTAIKLGHFGDMSGPAAYIGEMVVGSTQAYLRMVNDEGGILGRKLEMVIEDNKYDPTLTKSAFTKLVNQHKVFMLVNVYGSSPCTAIFPDIEKEKIPVGEVRGLEDRRDPVGLAASVARGATRCPEDRDACNGGRRRGEEGDHDPGSTLKIHALNDSSWVRSLSNGRIEASEAPLPGGEP